MMETINKEEEIFLSTKKMKNKIIRNTKNNPLKNLKCQVLKMKKMCLRLWILLNIKNNWDIAHIINKIPLLFNKTI